VERQYTWSIRGGWKQHTLVDICEDPGMTTVGEKVNTLDIWERQLLMHLDVTDATENTIWFALTNTTCYIATDGSAPTGKGSFAWVISNSEGEILAQCYGPVLGAQISSYRAEAYGILSVLRFLLHLNHLRRSANGEVNELLSHTLVCDNRSIILRINQLQQWRRIYPNATMESEWDVLAEIRETLHQFELSSQPTFQHIKGHQDQLRPLADLSLEAQLNCTADKLAETYLRRFPDVNHSTVSLLPTAGCQLHLDQGTITLDL
jgi:hypothetical protein